MTDTAYAPLLFDESGITWQRFASGFPGRPDGTHPSDGLGLWVLGVDRSTETVDIFFRMDPWVRCQPHRHLGHTTTVVVAGEQHTYSLQDGEWVETEVRRPGSYAVVDGDHFHQEGGGPAGGIVHLSMQAVDGMVWEVMDERGAPTAYATLDDFEHVLHRQHGAAEGPPPSRRCSL